MGALCTRPKVALKEVGVHPSQLQPDRGDVSRTLLLMESLTACATPDRLPIKTPLMRLTYLLLSLWLSCVAGAMAAQPEGGRFESLGIPVRVGGLMGCIVGPNGRGGEALYFNLNQAAAPLFLVQVDPDTGEAHQFNAPQ